MKKVIAIVVMLLVCGAWFVDTRQSAWVPVRTTVTADDGVLDGTTAALTYQFSDRGTICAPLNNTCNIAELHFYGTDAADEVCNFKIYMYRENGPAVLAATCVATLGTALRSAGVYYADTITLTDTWSYSGSSIAVRDASGGNRVATLALDTRGYKYMRVEIDIPASSQVASFSCEMAEY